MDAAPWRIRLKVTWLAAANSASNNVFYDFWESSSELTWKLGSDRVLTGVRRAVRRGPNRSGDGYVRDTVGKFEVGGVVFFGGGSRKGGFGRTPRTPPGYGPGVC